MSTSRGSGFVYAYWILMHIGTLTKTEIDYPKQSLTGVRAIALETLSSHVRESTVHHFLSHTRDGDEFDGEQM